MAAAVTIVAGLDGHGPAASVLCSGERIHYAREPIPAPRLAEPATLRVGEARVVGGGYGDPLPTWSPRLIGDASLVRTDTRVFVTHKRCKRVLAGYRYIVLTAVRPGELTVVTKSTAGEEQARRIQIVA
jgi:hypothetical protein